MTPASIFIVDDHPLVRHGLNQLIAGEPDLSVCGEAASVRQTLDTIANCVPGPGMPDLAIVDLSLPDGNGLKLIKRLLARYPKLSILISSMHDEKLFTERVLRAGAKGYINKSASGDEVINAISQILEGKVYTSPQVAEQLSQVNANSSHHAEQSPVQQLSNRELEVFECIGSGLGTSDIAQKLNLSIKTVESHRANIKKKLGLGSAGELSRSAMQWSLESGY